MNGAADAIRKAQEGVLLTEVYPPRTPPPPGGPRRAGRAAKASTVRASPRGGREKAARPGTARLDSGRRRALLDGLTTTVEGLYTHLPLKRAMYAADPVQRLRLIGHRVEALDELAFHHELTGIFTDLRDAHTRYVGPASLRGHVAMLPFLVEAYGAPPSVGYVVSKMGLESSLIGDPHFVSGVQLVWWNGVPMDRAVEVYAEHETGGRWDSRRARALESLTFRSLQFGPPPDEHWVVVGYLDEGGKEREVRIPWRVVRPRRSRTAGRAGARHAGRYAIDPAAEAVRRVKKLLFAPDRWLADNRPQGRRGSRKGEKETAAGEWFQGKFQDNVSARVVETSADRFGYLRLWSFDLWDDDAFVREVIRLLDRLPDEGLIIDLRANPGGLIWAAERLLQLFGPQRIAPTRFSLLATPLTRAMAHAPQNEQELAPWRTSLDDALSTGELYSQAVPITPVERCNDIGQVFGGPVVAVVDANTYSAGDLFAAGFYDNGLGILVTVGEATGAGGANVWGHDYVQEALAGTAFEQQPLPGGAGYSMSVRRATRGVGPAEGGPIEDVGVRGHRTYAMTQRDLVDANADLMEFCGALLAGQPSSQLRMSRPRRGTRSFEVTTRGLERIDLYIDDRPAGSTDVADGPSRMECPAAWNSLEVRGYVRGKLLQRRRFEV
jgi:hypothetical protein